MYQRSSLRRLRYVPAARGFNEQPLGLWNVYKTLQKGREFTPFREHVQGQERGSTMYGTENGKVPRP